MNTIFRFKKTLYLLTASFLYLTSFLANATVITSTVSGWQEGAGWSTFGDGTNSVSASWSTNTATLGWFYGSAYYTGTDVAVASGITDINQISDASIYTFTNMYVGPVGAGTYLVWRNTSTNYYGVSRLDNLYQIGSDFHDRYLDLTWWFQTDGTSNFSTSNVPEPTTSVLMALGFIVGGLAKRRIRK